MKNYKKYWEDAWAPVEFYGSKQTIETVIKEMPEQIKLYLGIE